MKNKVFILILLIILLITGCSNTNNKKEPTLLVATINYHIKYAYTFDAVGIFDDGTIYFEYLSTSKSNYNSTIGSYSINTKNGLTSLLMEKGIKKDYKVSDSDLRKIYKYLSKINSSDIDTKCSGDGLIYSTMLIFNENEDIKFNTSDCESNSSNDNVSELLTIINEYKKNKK